MPPGAREAVAPGRGLDGGLGRGEEGARVRLLVEGVYLGSANAKSHEM